MLKLAVIVKIILQTCRVELSRQSFGVCGKTRRNFALVNKRTRIVYMVAVTEVA